MGNKTIGRKGQEREKLKNKVNTLKEVSPCKESSVVAVGNDFTPNDKHKKRKTKRHEASGNDVQLSISQNEALLEANVDVKHNEMENNEKKKKKRKSEQHNDEKEPQNARNIDKVSNHSGEVSKVKVHLNQKKKKKKQKYADAVDGEVSDNTGEDSEVEEVLNQKKKKKKHNYDYAGDVGVTGSVPDGKYIGNRREHLCKNVMDKVESSKTVRKKKKKKQNAGVEAVSPKIMSESLHNKSIAIEGDGDYAESTKRKAGYEKLEVNALHEIVGNQDGEMRKKRKRDNVGGDVATPNGGIDGEQDGNKRESLDEKIIEKVQYSVKEGRKGKRNRHNAHLVVTSQEILDEKWGSECRVMEENDGDRHPTQTEAESVKIKDHAITTEGETKVKKKKEKEEEEKKKKKKSKKEKEEEEEVLSVENGSEEKSSTRVPRIKKGVKATDPSKQPKPKGTSKRVSFCEDVQVFPSSDDPSDKNTVKERGLVRGKRFSHEENEMVKKAVLNYIDAHQLGEDGLHKVLHCKQYPELKGCWKEIGAALPWRPCETVYYRAHVLFERDETHSWTPEDFEIVQKHYEKHGPDWRGLADILGKHRFHVKDAWRRIKFPKKKKGKWSQEEYQSLFDLVNMDLRMKAFMERKSKFGMLRDNIPWTSISEKLETRTDALCCQKWYDQLSSPMVAEGKWLDTDDYRLLIELYELDACCMEDVDWDNLLEHRSGDLCRKRWNQMVKNIGDHQNKSFAEQVEVLMDRYCPDVLESLEAYNSKPVVDSC